MKKLILIMILLSSICWSASFKIGASANYQYITDFDESYFNGGALSLGFGYNFEINQNLSFSFETLLDLGLVGIGFQGNDSTLLQFAVAELPFYFKYKLSGTNNNLYMGGYLYQPFLMAAISEESTERPNPKYDKVENKESFPLGGLLTGITIPIGNSFVDIRYKIDILTIYQNITLLENQIAIYFCTSY